LLTFALEKVLEDERIENTYLGLDRINDNYKISLLFQNLKNKFQMFSKNSQNMPLFYLSFLILFVIIFITIYTFSGMKKKTMPSKIQIK